jgi:SAM-dependent methyltransferase
MSYMSEAAKVRDMPDVMKYITGRIADLGCGHDKITPDAIGYDGRSLDGVDKNDVWMSVEDCKSFDTVFSSHFLEHVPDPYLYILNWHLSLKDGGHLVLYLPDAKYYDNYRNPEHMYNWSYTDFLFWFTRSFCGEGKNYKGEFLPKLFELVDSGMDVGIDKYSFFLIARKA